MRHITQDLKDIFLDLHLTALKCLSLIASVIEELTLNLMPTCIKVADPLPTRSLPTFAVGALGWVTSVVSNSLQPHGLWPTRLLCPWDSLGKNTGVGCHALLQALRDPGIEPRPLRSPAMAVGFFTTSAIWEAGSKKTWRQRHRASINHVQSSHLSHFQFFLIIYAWMKDFPNHKESACDAGDQSSIPGSGRSSGERNGHPLQYSCLENPMDREAWWATVHPWGHKEWDTISN